MAIPKYEEALKNAILNNDWTKCGDENYEGGREHFRDRVDCMKQISKAIADGDTKEFEDLMQYDDNRRIVNFYKEPLLERVIKHKPEFFKPLLERSSEVRDYYHCNMDDLHKLDSKRFVAYLSTNKQVTPLTLLIGAIKEDKREVVAMILSSFHNQVTLAYKTASDLKKKPIMDYLRQLATENKSYKVLPYLLDYDKYISHEDYGDWGATNDIPISDSLDEISSRLYKAENLERKAQRDYPNDKPIPPYISKGRKKIVDRKLKLIKAVLAKKKEDVTKKDVMQFFSLLVDAGCYVLDDLDGAKEFVHDHALALLKLSVSYRRYTLLALSLIHI